MDYNEPQMQLRAVIDGLKRIKEEISQQMSHRDLETLRIGVLNDLDRVTNRLSALAGESLVGEQTVALGPVTSFFGEKIDKEAPVIPEILRPSTNEKEEFIRKRDDLYVRITDMKDKEVFMLTNEPAGVALIRSVAKKAGHEEFRDAPIDVDFLKVVRTKIKAIADTEAALAAAEKGVVELARKKAEQLQSEDSDEPEEGIAGKATKVSKSKK